MQVIRDVLPATGRRPTDPAPAEAEAEIEITPAMLAAGARVYWRHPKVDEPSEDDLPEVLADIFRAMISAQRKPYLSG